MGDVAKFFGDVVSGYNKGWSDIWNGASNVANFLTGSKTNVASMLRDAHNDELKKSDLRGAQTETFLSGLPYIGDFLRGVEGVFRLEDLYNATGKIPAYPASQGVGAGAAGHAFSQAVSKIADGKNDLYEYYTGSPDDFRSQMNYTYG